MHCRSEDLREGANMKSTILVFVATITLVMNIACSANHANDAYKDQVKKALEQADLKDVTVEEDRDKNTITLGGTLHSNDAKAKAGEVARSAAPNRQVANEIRVKPMGIES